jgi:D-alanyl-D-alanine carboxypeptidase (penicillin-binding protein 5/6)
MAHDAMAEDAGRRPVFPAGRRMAVVVMLVAMVVGAFARRHAAAAGSADSLDDLLLPLLEQHEGRVAAAVRHLGSGATFAHHADERMPTASLVKLPVMIAAYAAAHAGQVRLDEKLVFTAADLVPGSTVLDKLSPGATFTLRDAIRMMIAASDNTATNLVLSRIGLPATNALLDRLALGGIRLNSFVYRRDTSLDADRSRACGLGCGTAADFVELLALVHSGELERRGIIAAGDSAAMLDHLLACEDRGMSPRDLPDGYRVAHKTGLVSGTRTDAGIILGPAGPIAFCLLTADNRDRRAPGGEADELAARFARELVGQFEAIAAEARDPEPLVAGASGELVVELQRTLGRRLDGVTLVVDGEFGPATAAAVREFQRQAGLPETGGVDAATWQALGTLAAPPVAPPGAPADADDPAGLPAVTCAAWAVADAASGELLMAHEPDARRSPASIVKVMTALLVLEDAAARPGGLEELVVVSDRAGTETGSTAGLRPGDTAPVGELLYGLLLPSGNDAAVALAEHVGGRLDGDEPLEAFVAAMNRRAAAAGLAHTRYANPHGKTAPGAGSTAGDTARLVATALRSETFRGIVATRHRTATLANAAGYRREVVWRNTNRLLGIDGYAGVKTGTTQAAGCCLAALGSRGGREIIVVVLGATSTDARYTDARNLFHHAWRSLEAP